MDRSELSRLSPAELIDLALQLQANVENLKNRVVQLESQLPETESGKLPDESPQPVHHHQHRHRHRLRFFFPLQRVTGLQFAIILLVLLLSVLLAVYIVVRESNNSTQSAPSGFGLQDRVAASFFAYCVASLLTGTSEFVAWFGQLGAHTRRIKGRKSTRELGDFGHCQVLFAAESEDGLL